MPRINSSIPVREIAAASDIYNRGYHKGNPGGLDAVDTDLAGGNIKEGVTIFGKLGTYAGEALAEDVVGSAVTLLNGNSSGGFRYFHEAIPQFATELIATKDLTFDAASMAVAVGYTTGMAFGNMKLQLIMGGVQVAESAEMDNSVNWIVVGTRALSGLQTCLVQIYNYASANDVRLAGNLSGEDCAGGIGIGSIKG